MRLDIVQYLGQALRVFASVLRAISVVDEKAGDQLSQKIIANARVQVICTRVPADVIEYHAGDGPAQAVIAPGVRVCGAVTGELDPVKGNIAEPEQLRLELQRDQQAPSFEYSS